MQIASFILVQDRLLRQFEDQLEVLIRQTPSPNVTFASLVPLRLQELGAEHPISIPFSSLHPLDQVAERQHAASFSHFEDPRRPSRLGRMAQAVNLPIYYVSPGRVCDFARALASLPIARSLHPEDAEGLLGRRLTREDFPRVVTLLEQFRHDLLQVYADAVEEGKGVVVVVVNQSDELTTEEEYPRAA
jgi:hypothetical protein